MEDDEAWLYGEDQATEPQAEKDEIQAKDSEEIVTQEAAENDTAEEKPEITDQQIAEAEADPVETNNATNGGSEEDDDSEDDDIQITIDHNKIDEAKTSYQTLGLNKPVSMTTRTPGMLGGLSVVEKKGKFNVEEFDQLGTINGQPAQDVDLESIEDKPWKKPGADITDYFNYGFTEDTWQAYCSRQRRMRVNESGAGLPAGPGGSSHHYNRTTQLNSSGISNGKLSASTNSSAPSSIPTLGSSAPPIRLTGTGVPGLTINTSESIDHETEKKQEPAPISVMTSDKRIYSKKVLEGIDPANPSAPTTDFSLPPPGIPPPGIPPPMNVPPPGLPSMNVPPPGMGAPPPNVAPSGDFDFSHNDENYEDYYGGGYEPTQESQWQIPPAYQDQTPPPNSDAPPGDTGYDEHKSDADPWKNSRRPSRESPSHRTEHFSDPRMMDPRDSRMDPRYDPRYDSRQRSSERRMVDYESSRKRRRSRSPSPRSRSDRYRDYGGRDRESSRSERDRIERDRDRDRDRDHRYSEQRDRDSERSKERDKDRNRDDERRSERERSDRRERERTERSSRSDRAKDRSRSKSRSPSSSHKHKKSKKDKKEKGDKLDIKKEIKEEPV